MIVFALTTLGAVSLSLSMRQHWKQVLPRHTFSRSRSITLRCLGFLLLLIAGVLASRDHGVIIGITLSLGLLNLAVIGIALLLPYLRRG
ncbi:MAG: DUF3325 family protein [Acidobacteriota bacterium]